MCNLFLYLYYFVVQFIIYICHCKYLLCFLSAFFTVAAADDTKVGNKLISVQFTKCDQLRHAGRDAHLPRTGVVLWATVQFGGL